MSRFLQWPETLPKQNKIKLGKGRQQEENITLLTCNSHPTAHATVGFHNKSDVNQRDEISHKHTDSLQHTPRPDPSGHTESHDTTDKHPQHPENSELWWRTANTLTGIKRQKVASCCPPSKPDALLSRFLLTPKYLQKWKRAKYKF